MPRIPARPLVGFALAAGLLLPLAGPVAAAEDPELARCQQLLAVFDQIVQSRFDAPTLGITDRRLQEARNLRNQAEDDCAIGQTWFGLDAIETALRQIGYLPPPRPAPTP